MLIPLSAADRMTVTKPTDPQIPVTISAVFTHVWLPSRDRVDADECHGGVQDARVGVRA